MFRLLKDRDPETPATIATIPENVNFKCHGDNFAEKILPFSYNEDHLKIKGGCAIELFNGEDWLQMPNREDIDFDPALNLDIGNELEPMNDYSVYLCLPGQTPEIVVSKNNTFPNGYTADNSRKISGFHYGTIRKVSDDGLWVPIDSTGNKFGNSGTKWQDNVTLGIIPNSVWDLRNCPRTLYSGMVKVGHIWVSIYQASAKIPITFMGGTNGLHVAEGELQSKYGQLPVTGTEGLNQYNFVELANRAGMRLLFYKEWLCAAYGSPQGEDGSNNYGWTKTTNTARTRTGCRVNPDTGLYDTSAGGVKPYAVSAKNVADCAGNVWEWLSDYAGRYDAGSGAWAWHNQLGAGMGQIHAWKADGFSVLRAGGHWDEGVYCGPRTVFTYSSPWLVNTAYGSRLACDAA